MLYKIYAGLGGSFGGAEYQYTEDFPDEDYAMEAAYYEAINIYESYEGRAGLRSYDDIIEEYMEENNITDFKENNLPSYMQDEYEEEIESWIDYYVEPTDKEDGE